MKTNTFRLSAYLLLLLLLPGCALEGFFSKDHVLTNPDSSTYRLPFLANDYSKQMQGHERIKPFFLADHTRIYLQGEQRQYQELTAANLQQIAQQNQLTLMTFWDPTCQPSYHDIVMPFLKTASRIVKHNKKHEVENVSIVMASVSYHVPAMDAFFDRTRYPFQTYIIPTALYHKRIYLKRVKFNKELMPDIYAVEKDDLVKYDILLLNNSGEVIGKVDFDIRNPGRYLADLAKLEQKIIDLSSKETAQN